MHLPWWVRARAMTEGRVVRAVLAVPALRDHLGRSRAAPVDGAVLDPEFAALLRLDDLVNSSDLRGLDPGRARARVAADILTCEAPSPEGVESRALSIPGPAGERPARLYVPMSGRDPGARGRTASAGVLYLHGGGFVTGDLDTHDAFCRRIALGAGVRVVALDYRLAPEHPYPAAVEDAVAAFRWLGEHAASLDIDPERIAVAGDSAGGNLSAVVAQRTRADRVRPALQVLLYPAVDARRSQRSHATFAKGYFLTQEMIDWYYQHYAPDVPRRLEPDFSPLLASDLAGVAPALVYSAGFDPLRDESSEYADRLRQDGVSARLVCFETMMHGFVLLTGVCRAAAGASQRIVSEIGAALRA